MIIPDGSTNDDLKCLKSGSTANNDLSVLDLGSTTDEVYLGPLPFYKFKIDFSAETCDIMWPNEETAQVENSGKVYSETYTTDATHPSYVGKCHGHALTYGNVEVNNPKRAVVDLNKMVCHLPEDCTSRRLKIDKERWESYSTDTSKRWTD